MIKNGSNMQKIFIIDSLLDDIVKKYDITQPNFLYNFILYIAPAQKVLVSKMI